MKFEKYGRFWYIKRKEATKDRKEGELVYFDEQANAYYLLKKKTSLWARIIKW